jgi:hypothetical protein
VTLVGYVSHLDDEVGSLRLWPAHGEPPLPPECDPEAGQIMDFDIDALTACGIVEEGQPVCVEDGVARSLGPAQGTIPYKIRDIDYTKFRDLNE